MDGFLSGVAALWRGGSARALPRVTLVGQLYGPSGRGEHIRSIWRALSSAGIAASIVDVGRDAMGDDPALGQFAPHVVPAPPEGIRIFHLNGNEAEIAVARLEATWPGSFRAGHNIVFPAWELPRYPAAWARTLEKFDEVWTASDFVFRSIRAATAMPVLKIPNACEPALAALLDRGDLGLPQDRYLILVSLSLASFASRKNPWASIAAFRGLLEARPRAAAHLVLKVQHLRRDPRTRASIAAAIGGIEERVTLIDRDMTNDEARNLVRCSDCYLSLHRSEGFGRGPAEAMFFGRPVLATGWSGNMEFMNEKVSFPIRYELHGVGEGEYLEPEDQVWAEADVAHGTAVLASLIDDPARGRRIGARAQAHMRKKFSNCVLGQRYRKRFREIAGDFPARIAPS